MATITKTGNARRKRGTTIFDEPPPDGICECCKQPGKELFQYKDYAWCCNKCQWIRKDFGGEVQQHNTIHLMLSKLFGIPVEEAA